MSKLELILLGRFECLLSSDSRITLSMRKAEVLLAYLALTPGLRHPRERLINLLWSDRSDEQARNSLRQCLSSIKKSLGEIADLVLQVDRTTVCLVPELIEVDVLEFERLATLGDYESLSTAADLYQGEFLEGISIRDAVSQEWLDNERNRFKRQFIEILLNLAETQLVSHDFGNAIKSAERLVKQDPLGEAGWRLLMRSYSESGDRNHALMAFKRCSDVLHRELGVEPETKTAELQQQIKSGLTDPSSSIESKPETADPATVNTAQSVSMGKNSILVLPLQNLSNDPEQQYFSDGLTESIITGLARFPSLRTHSRHTAFAARDKNLSIQQIEEQFNCQYVVEGSVRRSETSIRISAQLVRTGSGEQIWGEQFDSKLENTFDLEDQITHSIVAAIKGKIDVTDEKIATQKPAKDIESYDLMLRGYHHLLKFNPEDNLKAIELLDQFLDIEPNSATAHNHLYQTYLTNWMEGWSAPRSEILDKCRHHIERAVQLMPDNALIQADYGEFLSFTGEYDEAETYLDRAIRLNPNDPEALVTAGGSYSNIGQLDKGIELIEACYRIDPYHPWLDWVAGAAYFGDRQHDKALRIFKNMPNPVDDIYGWIAACYYRLGEADKAHQYLQTYLDTARRNMAEVPASWEAWREHVDIWGGPTAVNTVDNALDALCEMGLEQIVQTSHDDVKTDTSHSIAVLPFDNLSGDPEQEYFSDGITESIILNLSAFPDLQVKSRNSSFAFKQQIKSLGEISKELEVDYIVEGSIRKSTERIRITVQLIEAHSGNQVWGKRYDAEIENLFDLEEELSRTIATTVTGQIESDLRRIAIAKGAAHQQSYDLLLQGIYHCKKGTATDMVIAIEKLHQCLELDSSNALAHATLYACHEMNWIDRWVSDFEASRKLCKEHASKALALNPELGLVQVAFAEYLIFNRDYDEAETHLNRALDINPNDSEAIAAVALNLSCQGKFEAALEQARLALKLDPYHTWARWILSESQFFCGLYSEVLDTIADTGNPPGFIQINKIAANIRLGRKEIARDTLKNFLQHCGESMSSMPRTIDEWRAYSRDNAPFADPAMNDQIIDCMLQAGLEDELAPRSPALDSDDIPSIAVLPFENMSDDPEQGHFIDGITTDLIATLSKFRHLRTVSHYSTQQYKTEKPPLVEIAAQQQVRYILEGSVRKSGNRVRVSAELIDAHDESLCWSERYDHDLDDLFALQDQITHNIALAMKVQLDDGGMANLRSRGTTNIRAWELIMTAIDLQDTYIRQNILDSRAMADEAIQLDPDYAYAWLTLAWTHWQECYICGGKSIDAFIDAAEKANARARNLDPDYAEVWSQAGLNYLMRHDAEAALESCHKAVELEPGSAEINALMAFACVFSGDYELALKYNQNIRKLCPVMANWYFLIEAQIEKIAGNFDKAAALYRQGLEIEPDSPLCRFYLVDVMMDKGDPVSAQAYADEIRTLDNTVRGNGLVHSFSSDPDLRERFAANLAKFDLF